MPLTVVTGSANSGKTRVLHEVAERAVAAGASPTLLVPTLPDARRLEAEFARKAARGVRTGVLDSWFAAQWLLHGDGTRLVTEPVRKILVARAISKASLTRVESSSGYAGFRAMVARVARHALSFDPPPGVSPGSIESEIIAVLLAYDELLGDHGLVERSGAMAMIALDPPSLPGPIVVNRFANLSVAQETLLTGLAASNEVYIALTWEEGHPATEGASGLVQRLSRRGRHQIVPLTDEVPTELDRVEREIYRPQKSIRPSGMLRLMSAASPEDEIRVVAQEIRRLTVEGFAPGQIAVAFRDPSTRLHILENLESQTGVPLRLEVLVQFASLPFGAAFLALLDSTAGETSRERLLAFLATPYSGVTPDEVARADIRWRRERLQGDALLAAAARLGQGVASALEHAGALGCDQAGLTVNDDWQELATLLLAAARSTRPPGTTGAALDVACYESVSSAVRAARDVASEKPVRAELVEMLRDTRLPVSMGPERDAVIVTEVHRLQSRRFEAVIVGGLSAREFSPDRSESLTQELSDSLGVGGGPDNHQAERLLFYSIVTRAKQQLVLIDPTATPGDDRARPSAFIEDVLDLYRTPEERIVGDAPAEGPWVSDSNPSGGVDGRLGGEQPPARRSRRGVLTGAEVLEALACREEFSVSEIETYIACPYRWFTRYVVRAEGPDSIVGPAELGSLAHLAIADFYRVWQAERGLERVTRENVDEALRVYDEVWSGQAGTVSPGNLAEHFEIDRVYTRTRALIEDDATFLPGFIPREHEFRFGDLSGRPFEFGGCRLSGSIDRIDIGPAGAVVSDYKSGAGVSGHARFTEEGLLQAPIYAAVTSRILDEAVVGTIYRSLASLKVRGAWIASRADLCTRGVRTDAVDEATLSTLIEQAEERVAGAVQGIRAARIDLSADVDTRCGFCSISPVCRREL